MAAPKRREIAQPPLRSHRVGQEGHLHAVNHGCREEVHVRHLQLRHRQRRLHGPVRAVDDGQLAHLLLLELVVVDGLLRATRLAGTEGANGATAHQDAAHGAHAAAQGAQGERALRVLRADQDVQRLVQVLEAGAAAQRLRARLALHRAAPAHQQPAARLLLQPLDGHAARPHQAPDEVELAAGLVGQQHLLVHGHRLARHSSERERCAHARVGT